MAPRLSPSCGAFASLGANIQSFFLRRGSLGVSIMWHRGSSGAFWCLCGASTLLLIKWALQVAFFLVKQCMSVPLWGRSAI